MELEPPFELLAFPANVSHRPSQPMILFLCCLIKFLMMLFFFLSGVEMQFEIGLLIFSSMYPTFLLIL